MSRGSVRIGKVGVDVPTKILKSLRRRLGVFGANRAD